MFSVTLRRIGRAESTPMRTRSPFPQRERDPALGRYTDARLCAHNLADVRVTRCRSQPDYLVGMATPSRVRAATKSATVQVKGQLPCCQLLGGAMFGLRGYLKLTTCARICQYPWWSGYRLRKLIPYRRLDDGALRPMAHAIAAQPTRSASQPARLIPASCLRSGRGVYGLAPS